MASTSSSEGPPSAPWKSQFQDHIKHMESPEFVFSSLHPASQGSSNPTPYVPRARFCIFRGFWAELPENKHNQAAQNDRVYASDLPTFTTDVRMNKTFEIFNSSSGHAKDESQSQGSGGGGPCEAVWWISDLKIQWRVRGEAYIVGPDIEGSGDESSGVRTVKSELGGRMRIVKPGHEGDWSWNREVTAHFGNLSPGMRGSFMNPPPGQDVTKSYDESKLRLGEKIEDLEHATARENFRVVVIKPEEVESIDLSDPAKARRQVYTYQDGKWSHHETWP